MKETLKSIRLVDNVLLALCAAILGFALSPNETSHFDHLSRALETFQASLHVNDTEWKSHLDGVIDAKTQFSAKLQSTLDALDIKEPTKIRPSALIPVEYAARFVVEKSGSTLQQVIDSFEGEASARVFKPDNFQAEIQSSLQPFRSMGAELISVRLSGVQGAGRLALECYWDRNSKSASGIEYPTRSQTGLSRSTAWACCQVV
jgi:hypothetical protein